MYIGTAWTDAVERHVLELRLRLLHRAFQHNDLSPALSTALGDRWREARGFEFAFPPLPFQLEGAWMPCLAIASMSTAPACGLPLT